MLPTITLVGRTNVGKSTLFNRLLERPKALVSDIAGTTRDRNEGECLWRGKVIRVIDTGGLDVDFSDEIERDIVKQSERAQEQADLILFVVDVKTGILPQEIELAKQLTAGDTPVLFVANKAERESERLSLYEAQYQLPGLPPAIPISAARGTGVGDLLDVIYEQLEELGKAPEESQVVTAPTIAVIGKPNVGKSTLLNSVLGEERFITSPIAHTTREPNDMLIKSGENEYIFMDTAGMRKKGKVKKAGGLEAAAVRRNEWVVRKADVTLLVVDATEPIGTQEKTLAGFLKGSGSGVIIIVNKWDLVEDKTHKTMNEYREYMAASFPFISWAPVMFVSALTGQRTDTLFDMIDEVLARRQTEIPQVQLDQFLETAQRQLAPRRGKGVKPPKVLGLKQIKTNPPVFELVIKSKRTDTISTAWVRYLTNKIRKDFDLIGVPVRVQITIPGAVAK